MEAELVTIGKLKTAYLLSGIEEYCKRLKHYLPFSIKEIPDIKNVSKLSEKEQKEAEGNAIISKISPGEVMILLDERGEEYTSRGFASFLENFMNSGRKKIVFVIGGPYGFSEEVYKRADAKISLSKMTFNHEMVRLFFVEQLYRASTIIRGERYHHD